MQFQGIAVSAFISCALIFSAPTLSIGQVYVDINATGANDGTSWVDAYTDLQVALTNTAAGEIWIAAGVYHRLTCNPCNTTDREQSFYLKNNVSLYGGFNGTETMLSERDFVVNETILSGDIGTPGDSTDNCFRVVIAESVNSTAVLDGCYIEEGNADGSFGFSGGGGILLDANPGSDASPTIRNCTIRNNYAGGGGGVAIDCVLGGTCTALFQACTFTGNTASLGVVSTGAAMFMLGNSGAYIAPTIQDCVFENNYVANDGGAISMTPTGAGTILDPVIENCTFINNVSSDRGGAIWMRMSSQGTMLGVIKNCVFENNIAGGEGGAIYHRSSFDNVASTQIVNCIFMNNQSTGTSTINDGHGGAICVRGSQDGTNTATIANCLFVGNSCANDGGAIYNTANFSGPGICTPNIINNTFINNAATGSGNGIFNHDADPVIANSILWDGGDEISETSQGQALAVVNNCIIQGGYDNPFMPVMNVLDVFPGFVDYNGGDYRLAPCAPAVDFGDNGSVPADLADLDEDNNTSESLPLDLILESRISDGVVDCGAYEYNGDPSFPGVVYVDINANGNNNGTSWANAFTDVRTALNSHCLGVQVWVAAGTYYASLTGTREDAIYLKNNVEVYGGFNGTESDLSERNIELNETILSGDIGVPGDSTDNTYRVVIAESVNSTAVLDGCYIEEGNADGSFGFSGGGGILLNANPGNEASPIIRNCTIRNNYAGGGGGVAIDCVLGGTCTALFQACTFTGNTASLGVVSTGAAMFMLGNSGAYIAPTIQDCVFENNYVANDGGAISMTPTGAGTILDPVIENCTFINNVSSDRGGAIWMRMSSQGTMLGVIKNCVFENNIAGGEGGAIYHRSSFDNVASTQIVNCIFMNNQSTGTSTINDGHGGAICLRGSQNGTNTSTIANCLFAGNTCSDNGGAIYTTANFSGVGVCTPSIINNTFEGNTAAGSNNTLYNFESAPVFTNNIAWNGGNEIGGSGDNPTISDCIIQGGYNGSGSSMNVYDADPLFQDPGNGDFSLTPCSPAIDIGDNSQIPIDIGDVDNDNNTGEQIDIDLIGNDRIVNGIVDLGALEYDGSSPALDIAMDSAVISCFGVCDGAATVTATDGAPGYTYAWSNGGTSASISGLCAGTYIVTVTDSGLCERSDSVTLSQPPQITLTVSNDTTVCEGSEVILEAFASGGTGSLVFDWDQGLGTGASHTVNPTQTTTYIVTVTDAVNCSETSLVTITVSEAAAISISGDTSFCTSGQTTLDAGTFTSWLWSTGETTQTITVTMSGVYSVTVTNSSSCTGADTVTVIENSNPDPQITGDTVICSGLNTTLSGGTFAAYSWSNGETTESITVFAPGTIAVTVTDGNGCTGSDDVLVLESSSPMPSINGDTSLCTGENTTLDAGNFNMYAWSSGETTQSITTSMPGLVSLTVTDVAGCTGTDAVEIIALPIVSPDITGELNFCEGATTTLDAGSYSAYSWSGGEITQVVVVDAPGIYLVTVTDGNGCSGTDAVTVDELSNPIPEISGDSEFCTGESTELTTGSFAGYAWSAGEVTQSINVSAPGLVGLTVTDGNGCSGTDEVLIVENANPVPIISGDTDFCTGESVELNVGIFDMYLWSSGETTQMITVSSPGLVTVTVTDANGCSGTADLQIVENVPPVPDIAGILLFCEGLNTTLDAGLFNTYEWSTGETTQVITVDVSGTYTVTVTDESSCSGTDSVSVAENPNPVPEISGDSEFCAGENTTLATGSFTGYAWSTGENTQSINISAPGLVGLTVTDGNGCSGTDEVLIVENANPVPIISGDTDFCTGESVELDAGIFDMYLWSSGETTQMITISFPGLVTVTVTDANGCSGTDDVQILENVPPVPEIVGVLIFCEGSSTTLDAGSFNTFEWSTGETSQFILVDVAGAYQVTVTDGNGCTGSDSAVVDEIIVAPAITGQLSICTGASTTLMVGSFSSYVWSTGESTQSIVAGMGGDYSITVTDDNGCTGTDAVFVQENDNLVPEIEGETMLCPGTSITLDAGIFDSYVWSTGETTQIISVSQEGAYAVTVSDQNGCTGEDTITVTGADSPVPEISGVLAFCAGESTILQVGAYEAYVWSNGETEQLIELFNGGVIGVTVSDENGCTGTDQVVVDEIPAPVPVIAGDLFLCMGESTMLSTDDYTGYSWSTGEESQGITVSLPGIYGLTVTDINGCAGFTEVEVTGLPEVIIVISGSTSFCTGGSTTLDAGSFESYLWSTGAQTSTIVVSDEGIYAVTVTDTEGCSGTDEITVTEAPELQLQILGDTMACEGETLLLDPGMYATYDWTTGDTSQTLTVDTGGVYGVTVSDGSGCTGSAEINITINPIPLAFIMGPEYICLGDSAVFQTGIFSEYIWSTGEVSQSITVDSFGLYAVTVTDETGCTGSDVTFLAVLTPPQPEIEGPGQICAGDTAAISVDAWDGYVWSTGEVTQSIEVTSSGTYSVTVSDESGCTGADSLIFNFPDTLNPEIDGQLSICTGGETLLSVGVFDTYLWSDGSTAPELQVAVGGTYFVTVTNTIGCTGTAVAVVIENDFLVPEISGDTLLCMGSIGMLTTGAFDNYAWSNGDTMHETIITSPGTYLVTVTDVSGCSGVDSVVVTGVDKPVPQITGELSICAGNTTILDAGVFNSYVWSTGASTQMIETGTAGSYSVTVTDASGCSGTASFVVNVGPTLSVVIIGQLSICTGSTTILDAGVYDTYLWSTGDTSQTISTGAGGVYSVTVSDMDGCTGSTSVMVEIYTELNVAISGHLSICEGSMTDLDAGVYDAYLWSTGDTTQTISTGVGGIYSVTVSDIAGCTGSSIVVVEIMDELSVVINGQLSICEGSMAELDAGVYDAYLWSTGDTSQTITTNSAGVYSVTVTDAGGCTGETSVTVVVSMELIPEIIGTLSLCDGSSGALMVGDFDHYLWSTGDTTRSIFISGAGTYFVTVTDDEGCTGSASVIVEASKNIGVNIAGIAAICGDTPVQLSTGLSGEHSWSTGSTSTSIDVTIPGTYSVTVTDGSGCSGMDSVVIEDGLLPEAVLDVDQSNICAGDTILISATGVGQLTFESDFPLMGIGGVFTSIPDGSGSIILLATTECGQDTSIFFIDVNPLPLISAGDDIVIQNLSPVQLNASGGDTYIWTPVETLDCTDCANPIASPFTTTTYFVTGTDLNGCTGSDSVTVYILAEIEIEPVNVFTPNGDGMNDNFFIRGLKLFPNSTLTVFNRWGETVYDAVSYQNDWDGTYRGSELPAGSYLYHLRVNALGRIETFKGTVTIIRE